MSRSIIVLIVATFVVAGPLLVRPLIWDERKNLWNKEGVLEEAPQPDLSASSEWWLASGGRAFHTDGAWQTTLDSLPSDDKWRRVYLRRNPLDTDNGHHPQNIFKLLFTKKFSNPVQELTFIIDKTRLSPSPNRNESSGIFLYSRYLHSESYYMAGLTMDGRAVVVKRYQGLFHILAQESLTEDEYDPVESPNLIEEGVAIVLRKELREDDGRVYIKLFLNNEEVLEAVDDDEEVGPLVAPAGMAGIRSDFMDVRFPTYWVEEQAAN